MVTEFQRSYARHGRSAAPLRLDNVLRLADYIRDSPIGPIPLHQVLFGRRSRVSKYTSWHLRRTEDRQHEHLQCCRERLRCTWEIELIVAEVTEKQYCIRADSGTR